MAIAFDASSQTGGSSVSSLTWNHTCTGSNLVLFVMTTMANTVGAAVSSITYNSVALTKIDAAGPQSVNNNTTELWYLIAPATGTHSIAVTYNGTITFVEAVGQSYTGAKQSGVPDAHATDNSAASASPHNVSVTTVADNCWLVGVFSSVANTPAAGTGTTTRQSGATVGALYVDSNGARTPAGSNALQITYTGSNKNTVCVASFAPVVNRVEGFLSFF